MADVPELTPIPTEADQAAKRKKLAEQILQRSYGRQEATTPLPGVPQLNVVATGPTFGIVPNPEYVSELTAQHGTGGPSGPQPLAPGELETGAPQGVPQQEAPQTPAQERMLKINAVMPGLVGYPRAPGVPDISAQQSQIQGAIQTQQDMTAKMAETVAESQARTQAEIEGSQAAFADQQRIVNEERAKIDKAMDDRLQAQLAESPNGMSQVLGDWKQVTLAAVAIVLGGIGAGITGGPNRAAQIIFGAVDRKDRENAERRARLDKVLAAKEGQAGLQLQRAQEDFQRGMEERAYNLKLIQLGIDEQKAKITSEIDRAKLEQLSGQVGAELELQKGKLAEQIYGTKMSAAIARNKLAISASQAAAPRGFAGLEYKPGANELSDTERKYVRDKKRVFTMAMHHLGNLIRKRDQLSALGYLDFTQEAISINKDFGAMIDIIRDDKDWGSRFEETEAALLIKAYLGNPKRASDIGYLTDVLKRTKRDFRVSFNAVLDSYDMQLPGAVDVGEIQTVSPVQ